jgi:uncharacterized protein
MGKADLGRVVRVAKERFPMSLHGLHGVGHWQRVRENGLRLARLTDTDPLIVELFAFLHDCCREEDGTDPEHGVRAALFTASLQGSLLHLEQEELDLLCQAIRDHSNGLICGPRTVLTCWDADRLDLGRVGIRPEPHSLCTAAARDPQIIAWAYKRSLSQRS